MHQSGVSRLSTLNIKKNSRDFLVMHYLIGDVRKGITDFANGVVLDIGCGNKPYHPVFEGLIDRYVGCDVVQSDKNMVDVICPATNLKFSDDSFDTVFSTQVMEHVDDPEKMLMETHRVLRPGGVVIFSVPFCWELHEEPYDYYRFSKYGLRALFERHDFVIERIVANGGKWAAIVQMNLNIIYSTFSKRSFLTGFLRFLFVNLRLTHLFNSLALWLDRKFHDEVLTLNYVVVARKAK